MKVNELLKNRLLEAITLEKNINFIPDLRDPKTGNFYTDEVNVIGNVAIDRMSFTRLPVKFGTVSGYFDCSSNRLTSLEGAPREVGSDFYCSFNNLTSLEGIHKIIKKMNGSFWLTDNPIKSGGIGLLLIEGLTNILSDTYLPAFSIIRKYIGQGKRGILACQEELIEREFAEYAKL